MTFKLGVGDIDIGEADDWRGISAEVEKRFKLHHGVPLGLGLVRNHVCASKRMQDFCEGMDRTLDLMLDQARAEKGLPPRLRRESSGDPPQPAGHNSWTTKVPWKGDYGEVVVCRNAEGKSYKEFHPIPPPWVQRARFLFQTFEYRRSFSLVEAENTAHQLLIEKLDEKQLSMLLFTDGFLEQGKSGVVYLIRKNRPTIALRSENGMNEFFPLCALCFHPVGYYGGTWAGFLPPSDEMLAHLLMIRGDEHYFWRKSNQIPLSEPNSGV